MEVFILREYERAGGWEEPIININVYRDVNTARRVMQSLIDANIEGLEDSQIASISKDYSSFHLDRADIDDVIDLVIEKRTVNEEITKVNSESEIKNYWPGNEPEGE